MEMKYFTYFRKSLTFVTLVGSTVGLAICLRKCLTFFLEEPSYTDISMVDQQNAIFPVVTFCPEPKSKYKVKEDILKVIILGKCIKWSMRTVLCFYRRMVLHLDVNITKKIATILGLALSQSAPKICLIK